MLCLAIAPIQAEEAMLELQYSAFPKLKTNSRKEIITTYKRSAKINFEDDEMAPRSTTADLARAITRMSPGGR